MTNKSNLNPFSISRKAKMSTLDLWQQQLQALRRASQAQKPEKTIQPNSDSSETRLQTKP